MPGAPAAPASAAPSPAAPSPTAPSPAAPGLDAPAPDALAAEFRERGYLALPGLVSADEVAALRDEATRLCLAAGDGWPQAANAISRPVDATAPAEERLRAFLCIHFPHKLSPLARSMLAHPRIVEVLTRIVGPNVKCMQSMLFIKHAGKPGQAWHQDECFIPTRDRSLAAAWIALDDATVDNGCLWVLPGSHRSGVIWPTRPQTDPEFDPVPTAHDFPYRDEDAVPVEVPAGAVVFFHGYLLHRSLRNRRPSGFRRALVNHYMSAESLLAWDSSGQGVAVRDNRDIVLVAGTDPYAYKGLEDRHRPYIRRELPAA